MSISNIMSESYIKSLNPFEKKILAMETEFDIEFSKANLMYDYCFEKYMIDIQEIDSKLIFESVDEYELYTEAKEKTKPSLKNAIKSMIDSIIKFINNTIDLIVTKVKDVFSFLNKDNITAKDFRESEMNNLMVSGDYDGKMKKIHKQIGLGQRLFKKACLINGVKESEVTGYIKGTKELLEETPEFVCKAVPFAVKTGGVIIVAKNYKKILAGIQGTLKSTSESMENIKKSIGDEETSTQKVILQELSKLTKAYNKIASKISISICATVKSNKKAEIPKSNQSQTSSTGKEKVSLNKFDVEVRDKKDGTLRGKQVVSKDKLDRMNIEKMKENYDVEVREVFQMK